MIELLLNLTETNITLQRNAYLKVKGSIDTNIYFVEQGSLRIYVLDDASEHIIRFGYSGDLIVSLDSFLNGKPSDFYIQAIKRTSLKVISKHTFDTFLATSERHKQWLISVLENLVLQQIERKVDLLTSSPKERYQRVFIRSSRLFQEIPDRYIAAYLRMSPETLSRLKKS